MFEKFLEIKKKIHISLGPILVNQEWNIEFFYNICL